LQESAITSARRESDSRRPEDNMQRNEESHFADAAQQGDFVDACARRPCWVRGRPVQSASMGAALANLDKI
jgi:hypothetical protein